MSRPEPKDYIGKRVRLKKETWCDGWIRLEVGLKMCPPFEASEIIEYMNDGVKEGDWDPGWYGADMDIEPGALGTVKRTTFSDHTTNSVHWDDNADYRNRYTHFQDGELARFLRDSGGGMKRLTVEQIALVLHAVAAVEGWDANHPSVQAARDGSWRLTAKNHPQPSRALLTAIRESEAE